jgi:hypothetical protein
LKRQSVGFPDEVYEAIMAQARLHEHSFQREVLVLCRAALTVQSGSKWVKVNHNGSPRPRATWGELFPDVELSDVELDSLLEAAGGDEAKVVRAMQRTKAKADPTRVRSLVAYCRKVIINWRDEDDGSERVKVVQSEPRTTMTAEDVRKSQREAEELVRGFGWGEDDDA